MNLVVGLGEVGTALAAVLECPGVDLGDHHTGQVSTMHIAFPYTEGFIREVQRYERMYQPDLVVVHSTVPVGTCDPSGWVHSPVRGRHPNLEESLTVFVKYAGGQRAGEFEWPGEVVTVGDAATTEAGKLWELWQFAMQVHVNQFIYDWCDERGIDAETVYNHFAESYNRGYQKLGEERFTRPVLDHMPGPIGGHCVLPGIQMLGVPFGDCFTT